MRNLFIILLAAGALFGLSQYIYQANRQNVEDRTVTNLTLWNVPPKSLPQDRQLWEEEVANFETLNKDIRIEGLEREYQPEEFITVMSGGKGPDLVKVWVGAIQTLATLGFLQPVDPYLQGWNQKDFIKPVLWESVSVGGKTYGIPCDSNFLFLLYRKDLFASAGLNPDVPPATWDQLVTAARALTRRRDGIYGLGLVPKTWYFQDFVWQAGGDLIRTENGINRAAFDDPAAVKALQFWKDLRWKYDVLQPDILMGEAELLHLFALGKVGMIFGVANDLPSLIARYKMDPQAFGIAPLPAGPAGRAAHLSGEVFVINASTTDEKKLAAWKWVQFDLSPINQLWKWQRMHELKMPIFPSAFSSAANLIDQPEFQMVKDALDTARVEPHVPGWPQVRDMLDEDPLQSILLDPDADPQVLLSSFAKEADQRYLNASPTQSLK
jgi:ABC-type glycerol-3-phosphate transport system substrate-binding protein